jgi:hypothetical protein
MIVVSHTYVEVSPSKHSTIVKHDMLKIKELNFSHTHNCKINMDFPKQLVKGNKRVFCKE